MKTVQHYSYSVIQIIENSVEESSNAKVVGEEIVLDQEFDGKPSHGNNPVEESSSTLVTGNKSAQTTLCAEKSSDTIHTEDKPYSCDICGKAF